MKQGVHFMGIAGSGTSAVAAIAKSSGFEVTGCDKQITDEFTKTLQNIKIYPQHSASHMSSGNVDILAISPAILSLDPNNEEVKAAKAQGIEVLTWQQFLGKYLLQNKFLIAICGTHGKSTTTAMIAKLLVDSNLDPTVILGATVPQWRANYRISSQKPHGGDYFVVEADEYYDNFLNYTPDITVVTNIEMDHPEYFKDFKQYQDSFYKFLSKTTQAIVANISDPTIADILKDLMKEKPINCLDFSKNQINFSLKVFGAHNKLDAQAAYQVGLLLGLNPKQIQKSLSGYAGIGRRLEYLGKYKGASVYSDFGHHPTEIKVTVEEAKSKFPKSKIWLIYEPHMFSRTKYLFDDFVKVFKALPADQTIILDIYPSREKDTGLVKSWQLVQSINKGSVRYASAEQIKETLNREVKSGDILIFMGAGDIDKLARKMASSN